MRHNGYTLTGWINWLELEDGRTLTIKFTRSTMEATFDDPEESEDSETEFFIDGRLCDESSLPSEVTADVIAQLELDAQENPKEDFGFPDD